MEGLPAAPRHPGRFISLKWKTLALVTLVLTAVHLGLVFQNYRASLLRFETRQAVAFEERVSVLRRLLQQSEQRLLRLAHVVPGATGVRNPRAPALVSEGFRERWTAVQLELQLEVMRLHDADGRLLLAGLDDTGARAGPELQAQVAAALEAQQPQAFILCAPDCIQYAAVPWLGPQGGPLALVLGLSLADVVLDFADVAHATVAVLTEATEPATGPWGAYQLAALSDAPVNEPRLRRLMEAAELDELSRGRSFRFEGRHYRSYARSLASFGGASGGYFLIFADTTEELADIAGQVRQQLGAGLIALLAALALLLTLLNRPMNRLRKLAEALPLLARHQYEPARQMISSGFAHVRNPTEIEVLESVTVDLAGQLQALEKTVEARNRALAEKVAALKRANELNDRIFATAPMVIAIQTEAFDILQMNEFGRQLLGYSESEVRDMPFLSLLADPRKREEAALVLVDVVSSRRPLFEQTGPVVCIDGSRERITWLHTRLPAEGGTFVLSIGLPDKSLDDRYQPN